MKHEPAWRKSSRCGNTTCVEIATTGATTLMRDSKLTKSPILTFATDGWSTFLEAVKAGEFDLR